MVSLQMVSSQNGDTRSEPPSPSDATVETRDIGAALIVRSAQQSLICVMWAVPKNVWAPLI